MSSFFLKRPVFAWVIAIAMMLGGLGSLPSRPSPVSVMSTERSGAAWWATKNMTCPSSGFTAIAYSRQSLRPRGPASSAAALAVSTVMPSQRQRGGSGIHHYAPRDEQA